VVPDARVVRDALPAGGEEGAQGGGVRGRLGASGDDDEEAAGVEGHEELGGAGVFLEELHFEAGEVAGGAAEGAEVPGRVGAVGLHGAEVIEAPGGALVRRGAAVRAGLHDGAEGRVGDGVEGLDPERLHRGGA
jgi:hypothetical protein